MAIGISPTVDFAFKLMLGSPDHNRVTIHFLNAILGDELRITNVAIQNPHVGKNHPDDKWVVLDILAIDNLGRRLNIEMQTSLPAGLRQRLAYYDARLYIDQLAEGERYHMLRPAIVICVLTVPMFVHHQRLHSDFRLRDEAGDQLTDVLQIHLLELTKLAVTRENLLDATAIERWAYFLRYAETMTQADVQDLFREPEFVEAAGVLQMIQETPDQRYEYISRLKYKLDEAARMDYAQQEGRLKGLQEGLQEGEQRGRQIGRILAMQEILGDTPLTSDELLSFDTAQLTALADRLTEQFRSRTR